MGESKAEAERKQEESKMNECEEIFAVMEERCSGRFQMIMFSFRVHLTLGCFYFQFTPETIAISKTFTPVTPRPGK